MRDGGSPLGRDPVPLRVGGRVFAVPWVPAARWVEVRGEADVVGMMDAEDQDVLARLLLDGTLAVRSMKEAVQDVLSHVTGRPWWEGMRLLTLSTQPETLGHLTLAGVDPWNRSAFEWCAAVYALHTRHADEKARAKFDFHLSIPPRGYEKQWAASGEGDDPEAVMRALSSWSGG